MKELKIKLLGSTKENYVLKREDSLKHGAHAAAICYMSDSFKNIQNEDNKKTNNRIKRTLNSGHHSIYGHTSYNLYLENVPKILAMVLNNEKVYTTSEKSARYTKMNDLDEEEEKLYQKWKSKFHNKIERRYPDLSNRKKEKLAMENARYLTSVFTPAKMEYTTNFRQLNYIMHWFNDFINQKEDNEFNQNLKKGMKQFNQQLSSLYVKNLNPQQKKRSLSLLKGKINKKETFADVYSTNYKSSFAALAQAQRHRTISYEMEEIEKPTEFYIPKIIQKEKEKQEWLSDLEKIAMNFPQATLVNVKEKGIYEDFLSKATERLCGHAQLEIMNQTKNTLEKYLKNTKEDYNEIHENLKEYNKGPKCTFPEVKCLEPCYFGKESLERMI
ncbi:MAG: FAD-dependent thymidylate synthase [Candidatus Woesearchaeota archaeon]